MTKNKEVRKERNTFFHHCTSPIDTLQRYKVSHVLNVAYGVDNLFPDKMVYKTLQILDLPETEITSYFEECSSFIDQTREQGGVVLVHCNAGVSRSSSIVIGYLMLREGLSFDDAYSQVKLARPSIRPNPGFYQQLQKYKS
ncbi:dual specificity protein phosphatase 19-like [Simochromis diagramma]|uniref:dual specificity protein phosphatase 19-like n=1 Tax=Simochromis diagramma TaxID=43689 RepID=UPI001A7F07AF|nr:dual specificity protein phosphatase 19-like [Simochromis diagramma]